MGEVKTIKVCEETYAKFNEIAGEYKSYRGVSVNRGAMRDLIKRREKGRKISDLTGSWNITDAEFNEIETSIEESWKK